MVQTQAKFCCSRRASVQRDCCIARKSSKQRQRQRKSLISCPTFSCESRESAGGSFPFKLSKCPVDDGRAENHICICLLDRGFGTGEGKNLYFTLFWELRVFLNYFTEGYGLAGTLALPTSHCHRGCDVTQTGIPCCIGAGCPGVLGGELQSPALPLCCTLGDGKGER